MPAERQSPWGADTPVSMPVASPDYPVLVDVGGFGVTTAGLVHNLTAADVEAMLTPFFGPSV
jgi:hypothetical protein